MNQMDTHTITVNFDEPVFVLDFNGYHYEVSRDGTCERESGASSLLPASSAQIHSNNSVCALFHIGRLDQSDTAESVKQKILAAERSMESFESDPIEEAFFNETVAHYSRNIH